MFVTRVDSKCVRKASRAGAQKADIRRWGGSIQALGVDSGTKVSQQQHSSPFKRNALRIFMTPTRQNKAGGA